MRTKNGWEPITAEEKDRLPHGTVSAWEKIFKCERCGQYVILTAEGYRPRYFKHEPRNGSEELEIDCPDRSEQYGGASGVSEFKAGIHDLFLPLRIRVCSDKRFRFELGFLQIPSSLLRDERIIKIYSFFDSSWGYEYSMSRIEEDRISYLSVGNVPQYTYDISIIPTDYHLSRYWPNRVEGIAPDTDGNLFYNHNGVGNKLPENSAVLVGRKYSLLTRDSSYQYQKYRNINIELICQCSVEGTPWYVYEVTATALEEGVERFFRKFGCYLSESAVTFIPIWPACIKGPSLFKHCSEELAFFLRGNAYPKTSFCENLALYNTDDGKVFYVNGKKIHQLLSAGRTTVLLYSQIWNEPLDRTMPLPKVKVTDLDSVEIPSGEYTSLPAKKTLVVTAPFDGHVIIKKHNVIIEKRLIKSNQQIELDGFQYGYSVEIFQGLDLVWSVRYIDVTSESAYMDSLLLSELERCGGSEVDVPHSLGSIALKMTAYPKTKLWLYKHIRSGKMPQRAYKILISHFSRKQERELLKKGARS